MTPDINPFAAAQASAVCAADVVREVLCHLSDAPVPGQATNVVEPVSSRFPEHPLDSAVHDLAMATVAAGRATENLVRRGAVEHAILAGQAARQAAQTLRLSESVARSATLRDDTVQRAHVAHAAAATGFAAAHLLDTLPAAPERGPHADPFPAPWSRLVTLLSDGIAARGTDAADDDQAHLLDAAAPARDAGLAVRHAFERHREPAVAVATRFARIAALVAAYSGCAVLVSLDPAVNRRS